ncbi:unnamed protein product, partial [Choristocarpus tenellus]
MSTMGHVGLTFALATLIRSSNVGAFVPGVGCGIRRTGGHSTRIVTSCGSATSESLKREVGSQSTSSTNHGNPNGDSNGDTLRLKCPVDLIRISPPAG